MLSKNWMESRYTIGSLVARSAAMQRLVKQAGLQINETSPLLIVGETGTGKSLLARAMHNSSIRAEKPFVSVSSERLAPNAVESVLFGSDEVKGVLARSTGGTLLFTNIEELSPMAQERLCRIIDENVAASQSDKSATSRTRLMFTAHSGDLAERLSRGMFSESAYHAMSPFVLTMPTLSERNADIPYLVADVLHTFATRERVVRPSVPYHYMELLTRVEWPENVRQLRNHVESVMALSNGKFEPAVLLAHFDEIESPQTLKALVQELLQKLVSSPQTAGASATN